MSGHTKEPWVYEAEAIRIASEKRWQDPIKLESAWREDAWEGDEEAEANARRIVECVNALAGYNPAALAALVEAAEMALVLRGNEDSLAELKDALLAFREGSAS